MIDITRQTCGRLYSSCRLTGEPKNLQKVIFKSLHHNEPNMINARAEAKAKAGNMKDNVQ